MTEKPALPTDLAHPVDLYVGARLRIRRKVLGLSQTQLADALGITFQQVQKYERGANRISASKLYEAARLLESPVSYFFEGLDETAGSDNGDDGFAQRMTQFIATPEGLELAALFPRLNDRRLRRRVVELVKAMVDDEPGAAAD
ncbi:MAG: helix-turn-helix transcriptional regulator [Caulobacter sp.]|nr:helix-turn-helix transcriptional regulator [Caulobacter sp.]